MSTGVYALLGVVVGALSTGAVQALLDARARRRRAIVAARLVLNSLEQYDYLIRRLMQGGKWSDHPEWLTRVKALPEPWRDSQSVLAEIRDFKDWVDVTNAFIEADDRLVFSAAILAGEDLSKDARARPRGCPGVT